MNMMSASDGSVDFVDFGGILGKVICSWRLEKIYRGSWMSDFRNFMGCRDHANSLRLLEIL